MKNNFKGFLLSFVTLFGVMGCKEASIPEEFIYNDFEATTISEREGDENRSPEAEILIKNTGNRWIITNATTISKYKYNKEKIKPSYYVDKDSSIRENYFRDCCIKPGENFTLNVSNIAYGSNYLDYLNVYALDPTTDFTKLTIKKEECIRDQLTKDAKHALTIDNPYYNEKDNEQNAVTYYCNILLEGIYKESTVYAFKSFAIKSNLKESKFTFYSLQNYDYMEEKVTIKSISLVNIEEGKNSSLFDMLN